MQLLHLSRSSTSYARLLHHHVRPISTISAPHHPRERPDPNLPGFTSPDTPALQTPLKVRRQISRPWTCLLETKSADATPAWTTDTQKDSIFSSSKTSLGIGPHYGLSSSIPWEQDTWKGAPLHATESPARTSGSSRLPQHHNVITRTTFRETAADRR